MAKHENWKPAVPADAIPQELERDFLRIARTKGAFWYDQLTLCSLFGLRNIEARELRASEINFTDNKIRLTNSKQVKSFITKEANKAFNEQWLKEGRKWLRKNVDDNNISLIVRLATTTEMLEELADEYDLKDEFITAKNTSYDALIDPLRAEKSKFAPVGRVLDLSKVAPGVIKMLRKRAEQANRSGSDFLFPANEIKNNRAKGQGFEPVTRQSAYRVIKAITLELKASSLKAKKAIGKKIISLHSLRKLVVQFVADTKGLMQASMFIGHGNGKGDLATTQDYLDKSQDAIEETQAETIGRNNSFYSSEIVA